MEILLYIVLFFLGASIVSFLTVFINDFEERPLFSLRRSHCDHCQKQLQFYNTIPILSYLCSFGKSQCCNHPIKKSYLYSELIGGIFFCLSLTKHLNLISIIFLFISLTILSLQDIKQGFIYPIFYLLFIPTIVVSWSTLHFQAMIILFSLLWSFKQTNHGIGQADIEILTILSLLFGFQRTLLIILIACCLCLLHYLCNKKRSFRFIPYIAIATGIIYMIF